MMIGLSVYLCSSVYLSVCLYVYCLVRLAWERGLLVAVQAGRLAALRRGPLTDDYVEDVSLVKPLLVLLCQLHSCRCVQRR